MPITASELILYGSANRPEDDVSTTGGAVDLDARPLDSQFTAAAVAELVSDDAGDTTQDVTVHGRDAAGNLVSEQETLNGTTPVATAQTFERITKVVFSAAASGTVTLHQGASGTTRHTFAPGETDAFILFIEAASDPDVQQVRHEKLFWSNTNGSLDLQDAEVELTADPDDLYEQAVAGAVDDTESVADRETAPSGETFVDDGVAQAVPGDTLASGAEIGVWIKQTLSAGAAAAKPSLTTQLAGTTT